MKTFLEAPKGILLGLGSGATLRRGIIAKAVRWPKKVGTNTEVAYARRRYPYDKDRQNEAPTSFTKTEPKVQHFDLP